MTTPITTPGQGATYASAGVDIEAGDRAVELMKSKVKKATRPEVVGDLGGFAGLFAVEFSRYAKPLLASSTDGVGTKLLIAQAMDRHDTIGQDLVGMVVDDLVVCGAEPLFMQDYISCGRVVPERMAEIVGGIAEGCRIAGCALVGGETAEHPGVMEPDEYDVAGCGVGIVDADKVLGAHRIVDGDTVICMASTGLHSNGYSLARHVLLNMARLPLTAELEELGGKSLGDELLTPTRIYARDCLALIADSEVHAFSHITGGGLAANLARVLPDHLDAVVDRGTWKLPAIFGLIADRGRVVQDEMERTFNMGVGMVAVVAEADCERALAVLMNRKIPAWVGGRIVAGSGSTVMTGEYAPS
ncbi:MAG: phosphoribosylformylglycinamidine cyclo-ligase [Frankiaceae bacterium]|nr:phosphoribosylformylglycinamidine cyclo-ligase [Frankiaceae bacterium]